MAFIYVVEHGSVIGINGGTITVKTKDSVDDFPCETVEGISVFGNSQLTTQCLKFCAENNVSVSFFSGMGKYYGKVSPLNHVNGNRLIKQVHASESDEYCMEISRRIIWAKVNNQLVVAKRYLRERNGDAKEELFRIRDARRKLKTATSINEIRGYEGIASRKYFEIMRSIIKPDFRFCGRSRHAKDPVNAMLNFGYSCLLKEIMGELENRGLSPYVGIMHSEHDKMPALACDMIEEWRSAIVDSVVISMISAGNVIRDMFYYDKDICMMTPELIRLLISKLEEKLLTETSYLTYIKEPISFRAAIWHQAAKLASSIDTGSPTAYVPITLR